MSDRFRAGFVDKTDGGQTFEFKDITVDDLMEGDTVVRVDYSTLNYKDGLVLTGAAPVARSFPMIPGIDLAGTVETSAGDFKPGDRVVLNGYGLSETHFGGYAQKARVKADWLVPLAGDMTTHDAMAIGTAGYTAMLCVMALEDHDVTPEKGPVLVTGAAGGVGSVAVAVLAHLGYEVIASTGREEEADYLKGLGASGIVPRADLSGDPRPLNKELYAGVVDAVGSKTLANAISMTKYGGAVAACGLAGGMDLPTSVAPFILRGVNLLGIDSVQAPMARRREAWKRLDADLDLSKLESMTQDVPLSGIKEFAQKMILDGELLTDYCIPPWIHIDWDRTATDLMMDYVEDDGHYFRMM